MRCTGTDCYDMSYLAVYKEDDYVKVKETREKNVKKGKPTAGTETSTAECEGQAIPLSVREG